MYEVTATGRGTEFFRVVTVAVVLAVITSLLALSGCSGDPSSLPYLSDKIEIKGVKDETFTVTVEDLTGLKTVSKRAEATRSNGEIVKITAVGPTLDTFLAQYGKKQTDYASVRFNSLDGYSIAAPREVLEKREIVLAYMDGKNAFDREQSAPLRVIVIGERAMYWARMVSSIEFETEAASAQTGKVVFLDAALPSLGAEKGEYLREDKGEAVSAIDLLTRYGGLTGADKVYMEASDGLKKNETIDNFLKGFIKYTGEHTPQFCSPDLPEGMNMNDIVSLRAGDTAYYSLARGMETVSLKNGPDGMKGIAFTDVIKDIGFRRTTFYQMTDEEGQTFTFTEHGLVAGIFARDADGLWSYFSEKEDKKVTGVVSVEAVERNGE